MSDAPQIPVTAGSVFVQVGSAGNPLKYIIGQGARGRVGAYSGGGVSVESLFSFGRPYATRVTGNASRITGDFAAPHTVLSPLRDLMKTVQCGNTLLLFRGCPPLDISKFSQGFAFVDFFTTDVTASGDLLDGITGEQPDLMDTLSWDALAMIDFRPLAASKSSVSVSTAAFNHGILISQPSCAGVCGAGDDGTKELLVVGDPQPVATIPRIYYTGDSGNTYVQQTIAAVANGAAEAVAVAGNRVVVAVSGTNAGIFTANLADVKLGTGVFTLATGITAGHVYNDIIALDASTLVACGASGRVALSTDGGYSFTLITTGIATAFNRVAGGTDSGVVFVGGASSVLLRIKNLGTTPTVEALTVTGLSPDAIKALTVPKDRTNEVYVGSDTGKIFRTRNANDPTPIWTQLSLDGVSGGSIIEDIGFCEARQQIMYVVQSNASTQSRVIIDYTGGNMANGAIAIGTFTAPANSIINSIVAVSANLAFTYGEVNAAIGFMGKVAG